MKTTAETHWHGTNGWESYAAGTDVDVVPVGRLAEAAGDAEAAALKQCATRMRQNGDGDIVFVKLGGKVRCLRKSEIS